MKISNNSNIGDIIINGKPYNKDVDIEIVDSKNLKGKDLEKCLLSENYSWEQDIEIRVKWKKNNE